MEWEFLSELAQPWLTQYERMLFRYVLAATLVSLFVSLLFRGWMNKRRLQKRRATWRDIRREVSFSLLTMGIGATIGLGTIALNRAGYLHLYWEWTDYPLWWNIISLPVLILLHDTYFYWVHRAIHHPRLFRHFHRVHHLSLSPTPWAAYSFSVGEGLLMVLFTPLSLVLLPIHIWIGIAFSFIQIFRNTMLHASCEFHPRGWVDGPLDFLTTTTHHNLHHQKFQGNYGFYFTFWDRLMGTEFKNYKDEFRRVTAGAVENDEGAKGAEVTP
ncbi:sterol desaturase family protein [Microbulbifer guangxiensis]|uniref:sterol desaturase family protein n=1 Tax=Microbulbifer guangxiensis TaxID=2904249 RepID=UPI001F3D2D40|nr:sterol desaturase family protein [Microbulbifer guangxiensis]